LNYTLNELKVVISDYGYPVYRAEQIFISLHKKLNSDSSKIIGIPKVLKENINNDFYIGKIELAEIKKSTNDDTEKYLFQLPSGEKIETVLIIEKDRRTICVSTQAGCNVGCEFCATGKMGFKKNLDTSQIISQIYEVIQNTGEPPTNIVYMGMGEPFLNYENFINSLLIITDKNGLALPSKRITVSTVGFKDKLRKFTNDILKEENNRIKKIKLAFSLHSTDNGFRESLIPSSRNNKLKDIYNELVYFYSSTKNKITYEYIFLEGLNDTKEDIKRIVNLSKMIPCNFNIIPFHPIQFEFGEPLKKFNCNYSEKIFGNRNSLLNKKIFDFIKELKSMGVVVNLRTSNGSDIYAACGQLAGRE
jgi:23S rRNA (adenine2503-C2)-methyltransferase